MFFSRYEEVRIPRTNRVQAYAAERTVLPDFIPEWVRNLPPEEQRKRASSGHWRPEFYLLETMIQCPRCKVIFSFQHSFIASPCDTVQGYLTWRTII
jgi:hypothetical protein